RDRWRASSWWVETSWYVDSPRPPNHFDGRMRNHDRRLSCSLAAGPRGPRTAHASGAFAALRTAHADGDGRGNFAGSPKRGRKPHDQSAAQTAPDGGQLSAMAGTRRRPASATSQCAKALYVPAAEIQFHHFAV